LVQLPGIIGARVNLSYNHIKGTLMPPPELDEMLSHLAAIYRAEGRKAADQSATALVAAADAFPTQPPCEVDAEIRALLARSDHSAAAVILAAHRFIPWAGNSIAQPLSPDAAAMSAVAVLMSPDGPIPAPDLRLGLYYQKPDTYYALHNHDADETYVILCGGALWTAGEDIRQRGPGDMIHHPSLMPHAFRTGPDGMIALWRWSGDVNRESYAFLDDPLA
jgi:mannose-6-phosphate isomerase-like protein (cupin superfamily)